MIEFTLNTKDLLKTLAKSSNIIAKSPKSEIYSLIRATLNKDSLELEALGTSCYLRSSIVINSTNFEPETESKTPVEKEGFSGLEGLDSIGETVSSQAPSNHKRAGVFLFKPELLLDILPLIKDETLSFVLDQTVGTLQLKSNKTKQIIRTYDHYLEEYIVPQQNSESVALDFMVLGKDFVKALKISSVSVGQPKLMSDQKLLNICFNFLEKDKLTMVSTDKYRLSVLNLNTSSNKEATSEAQNTYLFMPKSLQIIAGLCSTLVNPETDTINFSLTKNYAWVQIGQTSLAIQYAGNEYPDVNKIVPQSFSYIYQVNTSEFKDALKQAQVIAKKIEKNKALTLVVDPVAKRLQLLSKTGDGSQVEIDLDIHNYSGVEEVSEQRFNIDYLIDFVNNVDEPTLVIEQQGKRLLMSPEGKKSEILYLASGLQ
jgi:DNA polymerase III sliding clamp (beta) subunit (PCNA family)